MAGFNFDQFYLYRWRYWIGYGGLIILFGALLVFAGLFIPGGISVSEKQAAIQSASLSWQHLPAVVTNLPFYGLQKLSFILFGVSDFSIKLPAIFLSLIAAVGLLFLLRRWFHPAIALLASIIAITTSQFLFVAQSGTPGILYIVWSVWLLLLGTIVARRMRPGMIWIFLFFIGAALSLYTPLSIYAMIALIITIFLHPHLRFVVRELSRTRLITAFIVSAVIISPLVIAIIRVPSLLLTLLGIPTTWPNIGENFISLVQQYLEFTRISNSTLVTPVFGLGSVILIAMGLYRMWRSRNTSQSYLILIWLVCLIPVLLINPKFTSITFLPLVLLLTTGLQALISYWYRLFPLNPYARIGGLIPLVILVGALVFSGLDRYVYGYYFSPSTRVNFSNDLRLLPRDTVDLVVSSAELPFYQVVAHYNHHLTVETIPNTTWPSFTATHDAAVYFPGYYIVHITTNAMSSNSDRLYVYKKTS